MEIRKPGAAELKPALALAWTFLKDAASCFSDEGIRTFKRFIEYDSMAATLANGTTTWAAFSGLEPIGVIAARESHICLFFVAGPHQRHGIGRRLFETFRSRRLSLAPQAPLTVNAAPSAVRAYQRLGFVRTGGEQVADGIRFVPMKHTL
ncbi:MAG: GNAT family N-acetyltransferase [Bilophila wadsworthia]